MPFSLTNAPAVFQNLKNEILSDMDVFCIMYFDNILINSENMDQHCKRVHMILGQLQKNLLCAKLKKRTFSATRVDFLGYIISDTSVEMDPK